MILYNYFITKSMPLFDSVFASFTIIIIYKTIEFLFFSGLLYKKLHGIIFKIIFLEYYIEFNLVNFMISKYHIHTFYLSVLLFCFLISYVIQYTSGCVISIDLIILLALSKFKKSKPIHFVFISFLFCFTLSLSTLDFFG